MIDINKKYRTRSGHEVRIYAIDGKYPFVVQGAVKTEHGEWEQVSWTSGGNFLLVNGCHNDLIEVKRRIKQKVWVNIYPDHCCGAYREKRHADEMAAPHRIGCVQVEIDIEEGEGL